MRDKHGRTHRKVCAGMYEISQSIAGQLCTVTITHRPDLKGWIAAASWDRHLYTDQVPTKYIAAVNAIGMLAEREIEMSDRE